MVLRETAVLVCGWPDAGTAGNGSCGAVDRDFSLWANAGRSGTLALTVAALATVAAQRLDPGAQGSAHRSDDCAASRVESQATPEIRRICSNCYVLIACDKSDSVEPGPAGFETAAGKPVRRLAISG